MKMMEWLIGFGGVLYGGGLVYYSAFLAGGVELSPAIYVGVGLMLVGGLSCLHYRWATWVLLVLSWLGAATLCLSGGMMLMQKQFSGLISVLVAALIIWPGAFYVHLRRIASRSGVQK